MSSAPQTATPTATRTAIATRSRTRLLHVRGWDALAVASGVVMLSALDARGHVTARVRLFDHAHWLTAPTTLAVLAFAAVASAIVGRHHEEAGLAGMAGVTFGLGSAWLLLGNHRFAGPVILDLSRDHGVHVGDLLAAIPFAAAALMLWTVAIRLRGRPAQVS